MRICKTNKRRNMNLSLPTYHDDKEIKNNIGDPVNKEIY
jgi:hypothetical protein